MEGWRALPTTFLRMAEIRDFRKREPMTYMLDTNICIYAMKNKPEKVLQRLKEELNSGGTPIGPLDMLIAGHAKVEDLILVTNNVREFERVPDLKIENWAK